MSTIVCACGNDCKACPRYIATQSGNPEELEMVAELWHRCGWHGKVIGIKEIACKGCRSTSVCKFNIIECVSEKKVTSCAACLEYPCDKINLAFETSDKYERTVEELCSSSEVFKLKKAFFNKRNNLESLIDNKN
jgi:Protein of unknown function (DUF3795)